MPLGDQLTEPPSSPPAVPPAPIAADSSDVVSRLTAAMSALSAELGEQRRASAQDRLANQQLAQQQATLDGRLTSLQQSDMAHTREIRLLHTATEDLYELNARSVSRLEALEKAPSRLVSSRLSALCVKLGYNISMAPAAVCPWTAV